MNALAAFALNLPDGGPDRRDDARPMREHWCEICRATMNHTTVQHEDAERETPEDY